MSELYMTTQTAAATITTPAMTIISGPPWPTLSPKGSQLSGASQKPNSRITSWDFSTRDSTLAKKADLSIILEEDGRSGAPRRFYTRAAYVLSPLPVKLANRLALRGLRLPEYIISWYHSVTQ